MKTINIYGEIGREATAEAVVDQFRQAAGEPVTLAIASEGGSVFEGLAMAAAIRQHDAPVHAEVQGYALSMAANLALEADSLATYEDSFLMFHEVHGGGHGSQKDHENTAHVMGLMNDHTVRRIAKSTGAEKEQIRTALKETMWMTGKEAHTAGIVTELRPALALAAKFDIDESGQGGLITGMTDKIRALLGLSTQEDPPPADEEALRSEISNHLAEIQLQNEAIAYAREHIQNLEAQLAEAKAGAQAEAYRQLAGAGHEGVNVNNSAQEEVSLEDQYKALTKASERIKFRMEHAEWFKAQTGETPKGRLTGIISRNR